MYTKSLVCQYLVIEMNIHTSKYLIANEVTVIQTWLEHGMKQTIGPA